MVEVGGHGAEVAIVDAEQAVAGVGEADVGADAEQGVDVVDFDEGGELQLGGEDEQVDELALGETICDEEDGVGAVDAGFVELIGVDDEILAEDGEWDFGADLLEVGQFALEVFPIGETTDGDGAGVVVLAGDGDGVEVFADESGGGAGLFDFGDDVDVGVLGGDGFEEVTGPGALFCLIDEGIDGDGGFGKVHFASFVGDNPVEYVCHVRSVSWRSVKFARVGVEVLFATDAAAV